MLEFNRKFFKDRLKDLGKSQKDLAKYTNLNEAMITHMFMGKRRMQLEEVEKFAKFLDVSVAVVLTHAGLDLQKYVEYERNLSGNKVKIIGRLSGGSIEENENDDSFSILGEVPKGCVGLRIEETGFLERACVAYIPRDTVDPNGIGRISVITFQDGRIEVGHILPAGTLDDYIITTHSGKKIKTDVKAVSPILR